MTRLLLAACIASALCACTPEPEAPPTPKPPAAPAARAEIAPAVAEAPANPEPAKAPAAPEPWELPGSLGPLLGIVRADRQCDRNKGERNGGQRFALAGNEIGKAKPCGDHTD